MAALTKIVLDSFWGIADCIGRAPGVQAIDRVLDDIAAGLRIGIVLALGMILPTLPVAIALILFARV